ncbi:c-type cytochrome [Denitratisoma oestradiolicum]|uniref:Cytochrome c4 n=1 Tax=Denitratisoma oestradiolicum TaxID=311182 RepID=A0A6S6YSZ7_9PROT|nr:c-type cytochrome [Denitratisoma oestradiolicum]CAB1370652.1 Cytochrome c4 [Denitratisoma oestradiolicum]
MARIISFLAVVVFALTTHPALAAGNPESGQKKAAACMGCHGPDGNSMLETWPKLAGQLPEYIATQLQAFKSGKRDNEQMTPQARLVAEVDIPDLAAYFASQKVKPTAAAKPALLAQGERIFTQGKGRPTVVAACMGCHGQDGAGNHNWGGTMTLPPTVLAPAIGGQHAAYLVAQLKAYKTGKRATDTASVMRDVASRLEEGDILAVAEYASTLKR